MEPVISKLNLTSAQLLRLAVGGLARVNHFQSVLFDRQATSAHQEHQDPMTTTEGHSL